MAARNIVVEDYLKIKEYLSEKSTAIIKFMENHPNFDYMLISKHLTHSDLTNSGKRNGMGETLDKNLLYYLTVEEMIETERANNKPFESAKQSNIFVPSEFYKFLEMPELTRREGAQTTQHNHPIVNDYAKVYLVNDTLKYFDIEYTKMVFEKLNKSSGWDYSKYKVELSDGDFTSIQLTHAIHGLGTKEDEVFHKLRRSMFKNDTINLLLVNNREEDLKYVFILLEKNPKFYTIIGESNELWEKYLEQNNKQEIFELLKKESLNAGEVIKTRKNQSKWRRLLAEEMMNFTPNPEEIFCPLTYISANFESTGTLFRASHIKEFANCNIDEAFDINNGIIMVANADALFDKHLITIDDDGEIIFSFLIDNDQKLKNNLRLTDRVFKNILTPERKKYLEYHREVFNVMELARKMGVVDDDSSEDDVL